MCKPGSKSSLPLRPNAAHSGRQPGNIPPPPPFGKGGGGGICSSAGVIAEPCVNSIAVRPFASFLAMVLLLALSGTLLVAEDGKEGLLALLPRASELGGWQPEAPPHQVVGEDLFSLINGGAEIFLKAGFSRAVSQAYIQAGQQPIQLEIYEMTGPEAARAVFGQKAKGNGQPVTLGVQGVDGEYYLIFWQDRFFVTVTGPAATPEIRAILMRLSRAIEARIAERR